MEMPNLKCVRNEQTEESRKLGVKVKDNFNSKEKKKEKDMKKGNI